MRKIFITLMAVVVVLTFAGLAGAWEWLDPSWAYRLPVEVSSPCGSVVTNYQVQVILDDTSFDFGKALPDGSDVRVTDSNGVTQIPFWIESWSPSKANIWVKVPSISVDGTTIYLYYGNSAATSVSNGLTTFEAYDGFEDDDVGSAPTTKVTGSWTKYSGNPVISCSRCGFGSTFYDPDTGIYHNFTSYGTVLHYTSDDGIIWTADSANNPILTPTQPWEVSGGSNVGVPMVWKEDGLWYMLYRGGSPNVIGLATSLDAVHWDKYAGNPVLVGDSGAWDDRALDPWGVIKVGTTYYMWYNTIPSVPVLGRCVGLATSTNLREWTKDPNNPIFTGGRFCPFPFKYDGSYYLLVPRYSSGSDYSQIELYRDSNPTFYPSEREYLGVAIDIGPTDWDDHDQDTPHVLTDTIYRDTFAASGNQLWVYYAGEGGDGSWRTGMAIEENIAEAIAGVAPNTPPWNPSGDVTVVDDPFHSGTRGIQLHDMSSSSPVSLRGNFAARTTGVISAWMRRSATTNGDHDIYVYGGSALSCVAGLGRSGFFHYWDSTIPTPNFRNTAVSWSINTWYLVTIAFDCTTRQYDFVVYNENLTELLRVQAIAFHTLSSSINSAMFYTSGGYIGDGFVDDFSVRKWCGEDAIATVGAEQLPNTPPVANAGPDQTVEVGASCGASVTLDGSGSLDPDGDPLTYSWTWSNGSGGGNATGVSPTITLPLGTHTITLVVYDGKEYSSPDTVEITVEDTTAPDIQVVVPVADIAVQDVVTFSADVSDFCAVDGVTFSILQANGNGGIEIPEYKDLPATCDSSGHCELAVDTNTLSTPDGYYLFLVKAVDSSGNKATSTAIPFSIRNWAVLELLPSSDKFQAGRTVPIKFSLRVAASVDPAQPFVYSENLKIVIRNTTSPREIYQVSVYGDHATDYRIDTDAEHYITNFKTAKNPKEYLVKIWRRGATKFLLGWFTFETTR